MLAGGFAHPYFIWPNIDPFRQHPDLLSAIPTPTSLPGWVANAPSLIDARGATAAARAAEAGTWQANNPLMLDAHEFRAMWDLRPPHRWVVDLSGQHGDAILAPHRYLDVTHHEDRLYIPPEFVSLWLERGWTRAI